MTRAYGDRAGVRYLTNGLKVSLKNRVLLLFKYRFITLLEGLCMQGVFFQTSLEISVFFELSSSAKV